MSCGSCQIVDAGSLDGPDVSEETPPRPDRARMASTVRRAHHLRVLASVLALFVFVGGGLLGTAQDIRRYALYRGFRPIQIPSWIAERATVQLTWVRSSAIDGRSQPVIVVLPPGYAQHPLRRYPVLYLLHGYPATPEAFLNVGDVAAQEDILVAKGVMNPLIMVIPSGTTGFFTDKEWVDGIQPGNDWETFLARDVVNAIDQRFRTIPIGGARAIGGLSSGGYGALNIALHHPGEFRVIESWSGYTYAPSISSIFGTDPERAAYNSPALYLPKVASALRHARAFFWIYIGDKDRGLAENREFSAELAAYGIRHGFFTVPARHDWAAWRPNVPRALIAASGHMLRPTTLRASERSPSVNAPSRGSGHRTHG
jgi:enterochelin esterase-like enzyme